MSQDKIPMRHVFAYYAVAFVDLQLAQLGCKIAVWSALHAPWEGVAEVCEEMEKRFYFRGRDAINTMKDCAAYLAGDEYQEPEEKPLEVADPNMPKGVMWNGKLYPTEAEYLEASQSWLDARRAEILREQAAETPAA